MRAFQKAKGSTREHSCLREPLPAGGGGALGEGRGGASPVWPGGSVSDSWAQGGSHPHSGGCLLRNRGSAERGGGRKRGICSSWEGGPQGKRRNRLMLCRTPRVFLSGGITSTFRQEQELGGKLRHGLTARR